MQRLQEEEVQYAHLIEELKESCQKRLVPDPEMEAFIDDLFKELGIAF